MALKLCPIKPEDQNICVQERCAWWVEDQTRHENCAIPYLAITFQLLNETIDIRSQDIIMSINQYCSVNR